MTWLSVSSYLGYLRGSRLTVAVDHSETLTINRGDQWLMGAVSLSEMRLPLERPSWQRDD